MKEFKPREFDYQLINRKTVYQGKRLKVEELEYQNGEKKIYREHVIPGDAAVILPITKEGSIIMIQEPRTAIGKVVLGLPAGQLEQGEKQEQGAVRELEEETGYYAHQMKKIREIYSSAGYCSEKISIFLATDLEKTQRHLDETEDIQVVELPIQEVKELLEKNEISTASTTIALLYYFLYEQNN